MEWSIVSGAFAALLATWLLLSLIAQLLPRSHRLRRLAWSWLLPEWRFFAPNPPNHDYGLLRRFQDLDGSVGPTEVTHFRPAGRRRFIWNPEGRRQKMFRDLVEVLQTASVSQDDQAETAPVGDRLQLTDPYILLVNYAAARTDPAPGRHVQFGVLRQVPGADPELNVLSRWHRTGAAPDE